MASPTSTTQRETGGRNECCGFKSFQVTGGGHGCQPFGNQPFSLQPPEPGCQLLMAERPTPELPMPVPVTRHLKMDAPANYPVSLCFPL
jgi:hypothetical protein